MSIKIALAGNPNCGKTTLFNNLTGSNQYVGNWPGVTVEKKEGKLKGDKDVIIQDLPGIYSLSPYTLEEVVSRTYLVKEKPDAILNIIDGTNIERNLYLTTQLIELGIPVVMAVNMIDLVRKNGDKIDLKKLSAELGCQAVEISALKGEGTEAAAKAAVAAARATKAGELPHVFTGSVEHAIAHIEESIQGKVDDRFLRWYAIKLFERDGNSVLMEMPVSFAQAALGAEIEVPTIDGRVKLTIPEGTQPGSVFRLRGKGIPYLQSKGGGRGDQFVTITVTVPKNMTSEQKERLRAYAEAMNESVSEGRSGIFGSKKKR